MSLYGGLFYNDIGTAYVSADVPHLYRAWTCVGTWVYQEHIFNTIGYNVPVEYIGGVYPVTYPNGQTADSLARTLPEGAAYSYTYYVPNIDRTVSVTTTTRADAGVYSNRYTVYKWRAFLPSIFGVGAPLLASMRIPNGGVHAIDSIEPGDGGWYVYGTSAPKISISQSSLVPWWSYGSGYLRQNECGSVWASGMYPSGPSGAPGYVLRPVDTPMLPVIDAYAGYTPSMRDGSTTGISITNTAGTEVFRHPAKFKPIKGRADVLVAALVSFTTTRTQALASGTSGKSVVFYGSGQYLFDRAFYSSSVTTDYGCDGYGGSITSYRTQGVTVVLRNMIAADGYVYPTPVSNGVYSASSYVDNSHSTDSWGGPISNVSGSTSSGYQISTTSINQTSEYAVAIPI